MNAALVGKSKVITVMPKAVHAQEEKESVRQKTEQVVVKLKTHRLEKAARVVEAGAGETFSFYDFPPNRWRHIRTNNPLERQNSEIRRCTRVVGNFPDGHSELMLVAARLRYLTGKKWGTDRYLNMKNFGELG